MLTGTCLQSIGPLKRIRPDNLHFPSVIRLIIETRNPQADPQAHARMLATTSAFRSESPVFCISTVTAIDIALRELIYATLDDGSMPCDEPWPKDNVALFKRWMDEGMAA